jgi:uncharacterized protein YjbI with pentapeptide repeats
LPTDAATLAGVGGTVLVAITAARNTRQTNQATIDAAHADAERAQADSRGALQASREDAQRTLDTVREAQFADRYSKAIEQLGSDTPDIRVGGIYALEAIAGDSPARYHATVMEVLTAFIREHSRTPPGGTRPPRRPPADPQAALSVVGRRKAEHDIRPMDLSGADLTGMALNRASLGDASLVKAHLSQADLTLADLTGADLTGAHLDGAHLNGAHLTRVCLTDAVLIGADLAVADLTLAGLTRADFTGARLARTKWPANVPIPAGWEPVGDPEDQGRVVRLKRVHTGPDAVGERRYKTRALGEERCWPAAYGSGNGCELGAFWRRSSSQAAGSRTGSTNANWIRTSSSHTFR